MNCWFEGIPNLGGVVVEDDGVEVSTVVVFDEVIGGVRHLEAPSAQRLLLQQCLVQRKDHLQRKDNHDKLTVFKSSTLQGTSLGNISWAVLFSDL